MRTKSDKWIALRFEDGDVIYSFLGQAKSIKWLPYFTVF